MSTMRRFLMIAILFSLVCLPLWGCNAPSEDKPVQEPALHEKTTAEPGAEIPEEVKARLREVTQEFGSELKSHLIKALGEGGPQQAIKVCSEVAPALAEEASSAELIVRRVSFKTRNPADAPTEFEAKYLTQLDQLHAEGKMPQELFARAEEEGRQAVYYFKPILVEAKCLLCHGTEDAMDPAARKEIQDRYPEDHATGYKEGDFRGAFSAKLYL